MARAFSKAGQVAVACGLAASQAFSHLYFQLPPLRAVQPFLAPVCQLRRVGVHDSVFLFGFFRLFRRPPGMRVELLLDMSLGGFVRIPIDLKMSSSHNGSPESGRESAVICFDVL